MECSKCKFFCDFNRKQDKEEMLTIGEGECRKNPPIVIDDNELIGCFPGVLKKYWCGAFEERMPS